MPCEGHYFGGPVVYAWIGSNSFVLLHILQTGFNSLLLDWNTEIPFPWFIIAYHPLSELQKSVLDEEFCIIHFLDTMHQCDFTHFDKLVLKVCCLMWNTIIPFARLVILYRKCRRGFWIGVFAPFFSLIPWIWFALRQFNCDFTYFANWFWSLLIDMECYDSIHYDSIYMLCLTSIGIAEEGIGWGVLHHPLDVILSLYAYDSYGTI